MPKLNQPSSYRPQYVPAFQPDSNGIMGNNSAQTQMHVGMQKLIMEQGSKPKKALESQHMLRRQELVDNYNRASGGPDKLRTKKFVVVLPKVASPQPVISGLYDLQSVPANRAKQADHFSSSFLSKDKATWNMVYGEIDQAMKESEAKRKSLSFSQKRLWTTEKQSSFIFEPLHDAVRWLNSNFKESDDPLRIQWREVKTEPGKTKVDLYFVFPNTADQYERGFKTWMGSEDVTTP